MVWVFEISKSTCSDTPSPTIRDYNNQEERCWLRADFVPLSIWQKKKQSPAVNGWPNSFLKQYTKLKAYSRLTRSQMSTWVLEVAQQTRGNPEGHVHTGTGLGTCKRLCKYLGKSPPSQPHSNPHPTLPLPRFAPLASREWKPRHRDKCLLEYWRNTPTHIYSPSEETKETCILRYLKKSLSIYKLTTKIMLQWL